MAGGGRKASEKDKTGPTSGKKKAGKVADDSLPTTRAAAKGGNTAPKTAEKSKRGRNKKAKEDVEDDEGEESEDNAKEGPKRISVK